MSRPVANVVTSLVWVKRGVPSSKPQKVTLSEDDVKKLIGTQHIEETSDSELENPHPSQSGLRGSEPTSDASDIEASDDPLKKYSLDNYDNDDTTDSNPFSGIAVFAKDSDDPYITVHADESDDDFEDFHLKDTDNLLVVGRVRKGDPVLEVHVYNEDESSFYLHHDYMLSNAPICLESMHYDPGSEDGRGNLCAVGTLSPVIELWDLNLVESMTPVATLGENRKKRHGETRLADGKKGNIQQHGDAVIDLAWNPNAQHVLASASADQTVLLWDVETTKVANVFGTHESKVQAVRWHPVECELLLSGDEAGVIHLWDCRTCEHAASWKNADGIERLVWNHYDPFLFYASTEHGSLLTFDSRNLTHSLSSVDAHHAAITGLSLSPRLRCLLTTSADHYAKVWDVAETPKLVRAEKLKKGTLFACAFCPDGAGGVAAVSGEAKSGLLRLLDVQAFDEVRAAFAGAPSAKIECDEQKVGERQERDSALVDDAAVPQRKKRKH